LFAWVYVAFKRYYARAKIRRTSSIFSTVKDHVLSTSGQINKLQRIILNQFGIILGWEVLGVIGFFVVCSAIGLAAGYFGGDFIDENVNETFQFVLSIISVFLLGLVLFALFIHGIIELVRYARFIKFIILFLMFATYSLLVISLIFF